MTEAQFRNAGSYVLLALAGAVLAVGLQFGVMLSGTDPILIRPLLATFVTTLFGTLATAAGSAFRPRAGREEISSLVHDVGVPSAKAALEVEAVKQATGQVDALTAAQLDQLRAALIVPLADELHGDVTAALEQRMRATPAPATEPPGGRG